ncbi:DNA methyltransferase [Ureaplasma canigenitalium]|uniref:DNA methyltransferase n=1 Tax=Ureaplasma canigenitalium TaxID=42092 RepID=UPI000A01EF27|nr:DNA methyltransferase [Ureaplasma canigenitalium]
MSIYIIRTDALTYIEYLKKQYGQELFDAIITDPPYNISRPNNFKSIGRSGIDFGRWDYQFNQVEWIRKITPLLKKGGSLIIFNDYKNLGEIAKVITECGLEVKDLIRWVKNNPMPRNVERRYVTDFEFALWATKGEKWTFNKPKNSKYLRPFYKFPVVGKSKDKIHPTQKSVDMLKNIINVHTNEGDLIFDPFSGSGSSLISSMLTNRVAIGCELDEKYFFDMKKRVAEQKQNHLKKSIMNVVRSPLYYLGDKYKVLTQIFHLLPTNINSFYDVFGGGGTMIANVVANQYLYNDINTDVTKLVAFLAETKIEKIMSYIYIYI